MKTLPFEVDPILAEIVEAELAPYRGLVSPEMLDFFREEALVLLSTHPYPVALIEQLRAVAEPDTTTKRTKDPGAQDQEPSRRSGDGQRGRGR
ncbi:MAG: hypothetical protein IT372_10985 [Polyangiaceae bacterium]|nr:hypothetical protein [Polyangiaceae bacterium]